MTSQRLLDLMNLVLSQPDLDARDKLTLINRLGNIATDNGLMAGNGLTLGGTYPVQGETRGDNPHPTNW